MFKKYTKEKSSGLYGGLAIIGMVGAISTFSVLTHGSDKQQPAGYSVEDEREKPMRKLQQRPTQIVSGEIIHIDEDSFAVWGHRAGSSAEFENIRIKGNKGLVHKLIYLGPSSYKVGDKVKGLEFKCLGEGGIAIKDLNDLLTSIYTSCQKGYVEADGIISPK